MTRPKRNVVKFPKPCRPRKPGPPFGLTLEQLMQGRDVLKRVLAEYEGDPVLVEQGKHLVATFHPELTAEPRVHSLFLAKL